MMDPMRPAAPAPQTIRRTSICALAVASLLTLAACGGSDDDTVVAAAPSTGPAPTTAAPTTAAPTTTTPATTTTVPPTLPAPATPSTTTLPPTTTSTLVVEATAAQPIAPPVDAYAHEPVIEVGSIAIPKLDVDMTMYEGIRLTTLDYGPGHWPGSAMPGQTGNVVVAGHRTSSHRVFRNVDQLVAGDEIVFTDETGVHTYVVDRVEVVEPTAVWIVEPTETATATLFACHPPGSTAQRIVVFADLVESTDA